MFSSESHGDVTVVCIESDLDTTRSQKAKEFLVQEIDEGRVQLVIDLSAVAFVDSSGLGALVSALKTVRPLGGDVRICGATPEVRTIFDLTRLSRAFTMFSDRESAVESYRDGG